MTTILGNIKGIYQTLRRRRGGQAQQDSQSEMNQLFRFRYALFKELLSSNSQLLTILSDIDEKLKGEQVFGFSYIKNQVNKALQHAFQMVKSLNVMSGSKYRGLYTSLEQINNTIKAITDEHIIDNAPANAVSYQHITLQDADWAGGKNANLGEILNKINIPVPRGFAITTKAFHTFFSHWMTCNGH